MADNDFAGKFAWIKKLCYPAMAGSVLLLLAAILKDIRLVPVGCLLLLPLFGFVYVLTILHWKHRYVGQRSTLWGVLLLIETSGWMKLIYFFRHILPDMSGTGRYAHLHKQAKPPVATCNSTA